MIEKVAIVDDDTIFQFTTKVKIQKLQLAKEVLIFNDGEEIFDFIKEESIDNLPSVILLDINMPIVDGWDFLELYDQVEEAKRKKIKIFMLSSSINPTDLEKAKVSEFVMDYIIKPIKNEDLTRILT